MILYKVNSPVRLLTIAPVSLPMPVVMEIFHNSVASNKNHFFLNFLMKKSASDS